MGVVYIRFSGFGIAAPCTVPASGQNLNSTDDGRRLGFPRIYFFKMTVEIQISR
jgi:hypothetical protein